MRDLLLIVMAFSSTVQAIEPGVCYSAFHSEHYPLTPDHHLNREALKNAIQQDMYQIKEHFSVIRTFYSSFYGIPVVPAAVNAGLKVYLGVFMTQENWYKDQVNDAVHSYYESPDTVQAIIVGNENITPGPGPFPVDYLINEIKQIRNRIGGKRIVGTSQRINEWLSLSEDMNRLADECDIIGVSIYPFFSGGVDVHNQIDALSHQWELMKQRYPDHHHKFRITETGWPSAGGFNFAGNEAKHEHAERYYKAFREWESNLDTPAFYFSFYDRRPEEITGHTAEYEKHFGIATHQGQLKYK